MKQITFYLDFISPYAHLAFEQLPEALMGLSYSASYKPVLLGALLKHHGQLGPAEVPAKRDWTYRQVQWQARAQGTPLQLPASHPFNPLPLLRLAVACDRHGEPNRYVCEAVFRHVWHSDGAAADRFACSGVGCRDPWARALDRRRHHCQGRRADSSASCSGGLRVGRCPRHRGYVRSPLISPDQTNVCRPPGSGWSAVPPAACTR
jgi:hypothetical protein